MTILRTDDRETEIIKHRSQHPKRNQNKKLRKINKKKNRRKLREDAVSSIETLCLMSSKISWFRMGLAKLAFYVPYVKLLRLNTVTIMGYLVIFSIFYSREYVIMYNNCKRLIWCIRIGPHLRRMMESTWNITLLNTTGILETVAPTKTNVLKVFWTFLRLNGDVRWSWLIIKDYCHSSFFLLKKCRHFSQSR